MSQDPFDSLWKNYCIDRRQELIAPVEIAAVDIHRAISASREACRSAAHRRQESRTAWAGVAVAVAASILVTLGLSPAWDAPGEPVVISDVWVWEIAP